MNKIYTYGISLLLLAFSVNVLSEPISEASLDRLLELSGANMQIDQIPELVQLGVVQASQKDKSMGEAEFRDVQQAITSAFIPKEMIKTIRNNLQSTLTEGEGKELLAWYTSEPGQEITKAESNASTPEGFKDMMSQAQQLFANKDRVKFAQRLDELTHATEIMLQLQKDAALTTFLAVSAVSNTGEQIDIAAFFEPYAAHQDQLRHNAKLITTLSYVYSYQTIDNDSLDKYERFLTKPTTHKLILEINKSMAEAFQAANDRMAKSLAKIILKYETMKAS